MASLLLSIKLAAVMLFSAGLAAAAPALAAPDEGAGSARVMLPMCHEFTRDKPATFKSGACVGVVRGVWDMAQRSGEVCSPHNMTLAQVCQGCGEADRRCAAIASYLIYGVGAGGNADHLAVSGDAYRCHGDMG